MSPEIVCIRSRCTDGVWKSLNASVCYKVFKSNNKWGNNDWLINKYMVSLKNTVKIHNVMQNKQFMYIAYYYK